MAAGFAGFIAMTEAWWGKENRRDSKGKCPEFVPALLCAFPCKEYYEWLCP
jgi:hypothetical protein